MAKTMHLEIITPDRILFDGEVEMVIVNTPEGELGFLPGHIWTLALLDIGEMWIREPEQEHFRAAAISGGFVDVKDDIVIYTDHAEWKEEIDVERATRAKEKSEAWLNSARLADEDPDDIARAEVHLKRAISRLKVHDEHFRS